jgi:hypothetical protein
MLLLLVSRNGSPARNQIREGEQQQENEIGMKGGSLMSVEQKSRSNCWEAVNKAAKKLINHCLAVNDVDWDLNG